MRRVLACTISLVTFIAAANAAETLNVKPGLCETSTSLLAGEGGQNANSTTRRQCLSAKDLERVFSQLDQNPDCKRTVVSATPKMNESSVVCSGVMRGSGKLRIDAPDPEHVTGVAEILFGPMHVNATFQAKWLSADCGAGKAPR